MRRKFKKIFFSKMKSGNLTSCSSIAASYFFTHISILSLKAYKGPLLGIIIPTYKCNLRCRMCKFWKMKSQNELDTKKMLNIIENLAELGTKAVSFSGGEPLIRKDILDMIKYSKKRGMITHLATNGTLVSREVAKKLRELEIDAISVSLDGSTAEIHDCIRGVKGAFNKTLTGLKNLSEAFRGSETSIDITSLFSESNFNEIYGIIRLADEIGIKSVGLTPIHDLKNEKTIAGCKNAEKVEKVIDDLISIKRKRDIVDNSVEYLEQVKKYFNGFASDSPCSAGVTTCVFDCHGDIFPCYGYFEMSKKIANVKNLDFKEFWFSKEYDHLRKSIFECNKCIWNCHSEFNIAFKKSLALRKHLQGGREDESVAD